MEFSPRINGGQVHSEDFHLHQGNQKVHQRIQNLLSRAEQFSQEFITVDHIHTAEEDNINILEYS